MAQNRIVDRSTARNFMVYPKMFSTDFIFRQQENLIDNKKCQAGYMAMQQNTINRHD